MGAWSAPAATVSGSRRPVHTIAWSDPDGDAGEVYDIEVYPATSGAPTPGAPVAYSRTGQTTGLGASSISHTPAADLPGGALVARVRVRTLGAWSAWSSYRAYTIVLTFPTITWAFPEYDGGWCRVRTSDLADPARTLDDCAVRSLNFAYAPPAGTTITGSSLKIEVEDPGIGGPAVGTIIMNAGIGAIAGGGNYEQSWRPKAFMPGWLGGTLKMTLTLTCANGAQVTEIRRGRWAVGEWFGAMALGDAVSGLAVAAVPKGDDSAVLFRAQVSPTAANGSAPWRYNAIATVQAELPATNAYLGTWVRLSRKADDAELIVNGSLETGSRTPWKGADALTTIVSDTAAPDGALVMRIAGDGVTAYPSQMQWVDVIPGATYKASGWARIGGVTPARIRIDTYKDGLLVTSTVWGASTSSTTFVYLEGYYTIPTDGSVDQLRFLVMLNGAAPATTDAARFDALTIRGVGPGDAGMDRLTLDWTSQG